MNAILPEHLKIVFDYLELPEKLKLAITGEKYSCDVTKKMVEQIRKKTLRILCANSFASMFCFGHLGILYEDEYEMKTQMVEISNYVREEKVKRLIDLYCKWISKFIIKKYNYNDMGIGNEDIISYANYSGDNPLTIDIGFQTTRIENENNQHPILKNKQNSVTSTDRNSKSSELKNSKDLDCK